MTERLDPMLDQLAENGGSTKTHALLPFSPALDMGSDQEASNAGLTTDQRGYSRFVDFENDSVGSPVDIGAYEFGLVVTTAKDEDASGYSYDDLSLREALDLAGDSPGRNRIEFAPSLAGQTIVLDAAEGQLEIDSEVEIVGLGADLLTIDANASAIDTRRVLKIFDDVTVAIEGLTITGGYADLGGGIYNEGDLTLDEVTLFSNTANVRGGGIYNIIGNIDILGGTISSNRADTGSADGGGLFSEGGSVSLTETIVLSNQAADGGGGIRADNALLNLQNITVGGEIASEGNTAVFGAGIFARDSAVSIDGSSISNNSTTGDGGGIFGDDSSFLVVSSSVSQNTADAGGGIYSNDSTATITDSTFEDNKSFDKGGALFFHNTEGSQLTVSNSTFSHNTGVYGNAIALYSTVATTTTPRIENTTISNNFGPLGGAILAYGSSDPDIASVDIVNSTIAENETDHQFSSCRAVGFGMMQRPRLITPCSLATLGHQSTNCTTSTRWMAQSSAPIIC